jgi:hypothetical protein
MKDDCWEQVDFFLREKEVVEKMMCELEETKD